MWTLKTYTNASAAPCSNICFVFHVFLARFGTVVATDKHEGTYTIFFLKSEYCFDTYIKYEGNSVFFFPQVC